MKMSCAFYYLEIPCFWDLNRHPIKVKDVYLQFFLFLEWKNGGSIHRCRNFRSSCGLFLPWPRSPWNEQQFSSKVSIFWSGFFALRFPFLQFDRLKMCVAAFNDQLQGRKRYLKTGGWSEKGHITNTRPALLGLEGSLLHSLPKSGRF